VSNPHGTASNTTFFDGIDFASDVDYIQNGKFEKSLKELFLDLVSHLVVLPFYMIFILSRIEIRICTQYGRLDPPQNILDLQYCKCFLFTKRF
jgi:hypothetical protein